MADAPTREEVRAGYEAAMALAMSVVRSKGRAEEYVQQAFEAVYSGARPWSREKGPFDVHMMGAVRSIMHNEHKKRREEREAKAGKVFQGEIGKSAPSPEERNLQEAENAQANAASELDVLEASLVEKENEDALRVLRCRRASDEALKAGEIAKQLSMPVARVYRANELIRERLLELRGKERK